MSQPLPDFAAARVLVAGDVMLDRYWTGATSRISPEAPVPIVRVGRDRAQAGGAANVALNLAALGVGTQLLGVIGRDEAGTQLRRRVSDAGIGASFIESALHPTITKLRVMSRNQQVIRLDFEESLADAGAFDRGAFAAAFAERLQHVDAVILSDYGKGTLSDVAALIAICRAANKPVTVDPKGSDYARYAGATLLTPNLAEIEAVVGVCADDEALVAKATQLMLKLDLQALLVTRSEKGMSLLRPHREPVHLPTVAREVFDVTGAGDTVIATLTAAIAAGADLEVAVRLSNLAAGVTVGKLGAATVSPEELRAQLAPDRGSEPLSMSESALLAWAQQMRARGQRIVMTNGCFDLLHVGHLRYLEAARALGDVLIVAVNSDASVRKLKGPTRPLNAAADRMRILAGLKCVDAVVEFAEDTPARLIARVLPDVLVKGGDYTVDQVAGHEAVAAAGGRTVILDFHQGYSTSSTIQRAIGDHRPP
ncbi:MAG: bifunctional protein RfaE, domain [Hydrocarboniphaga sp.]|uniref:bifunctional D-glycero-beta-D-manno-heptose-7-phosphate kinase/D-glycero-beta-D-manno-heptose 1-phosphate adenylyltransferase HldE n=1 Tax=Hydrocarboniphaga sp. TaxID=2033016 RepID=UPI002620D5FC|nr:bifunctional D-glycero-beta-D-manno-heptose-7-phosphate kinase/D-glycero-beta-D-manno-heptose 1-phosphate adenylyltransferase HldE [Hydrocarboniphaga sp.]MDB5969477.1 bifunctional protein RfaE, domain [Hydrocarboniphaga sp.]